MSNPLIPPPDAGRDEQASAIPAADRPALPRKFYATAAVKPQGEGEAVMYALSLDGKTARTPGRAPLAAPHEAIAQAMAQEWQAQEEVINPALMPMTRLVNSVIDGVAHNHAAVAAEIVRFAGSDLICYRADAPERLVRRQGELWDPVLGWARERLGARFILSEGVMFVAQPEESLAAIARAVEEGHSAQLAPYALGALHVMTTLTGSVLIALATAHQQLSIEEAWAAAHVDEEVQEQIWGADEEALARRAARFKEFAAAGLLAHLVWPD